MRAAVNPYIVFKSGKPRLKNVKGSAMWEGRFLGVAEIGPGESPNGRLCCEVPRCGFDFAKGYGDLGEGYAQIHHLEALGSRDRGPTKTAFAAGCRVRELPRHDSQGCVSRRIKNLIPAKGAV